MMIVFYSGWQVLAIGSQKNIRTAASPTKNATHPRLYKTPVRLFLKFHSLPFKRISIITIIYYLMKKEFFICFCAFLYSAQVLMASDIKGIIVKLPSVLKRGQTISIPLSNYYRGNLLINTSGFTGLKNIHSEHVPGIIEYAIQFAAAGEYELQAIYANKTTGSTNFTFDGEKIKTIFTEPTHNRNFVSLGNFSTTTGIHKIRFTSQFVETPFPAITSLRLVYHAGKAPKSKKKKEVIGYRATLPKDFQESISRKVHLDFHTGGFIKGVGKSFDPDSFALTLKNNNFNAVTIFAKCHHGYAYYNTEAGTLHPGLDYDLMKAQIDACHKYGLKVLVYVSVACDELWVTTEDSIKQPFDYKDKGHFYWVDANVKNAYVHDYLWQMLDEIVTNYDMDGIWFDYPYNVEFLNQTLHRIKKIKPGLLVVYNQQSNYTREHIAKLDMLEIEGWIPRVSQYEMPYVARYVRELVPKSFYTIRFMNMWGDFGSLFNEAKMMFDAATAFANGCFINFGDQLHPYGKLDKAVYDQLGKAMDYSVKISPFIKNATSMPYIALLRHSVNSSAALLDGGIHFHVVDTTQDLSTYKAVIIPDALQISASYSEILSKYVENGGNIIVSGKPGKELCSLLGITTSDEKPEPAFFRIDNSLFPSANNFDYYTYENAIPVKALPQTKVLAPLVWQMNHNTSHASSHLQSPAMENASGYAAITKTKYGKGSAVYTSVSLPDVYINNGATAMKNVLSDLIKMVVPPGERLLEITSQVPLETSIFSQDNRYIIHLVHCPQGRSANSTEDEKGYVHRQPVVDGAPQVSNTIVFLPEHIAKGKSLKAIISGKPVPFEQTPDGRIRFIVPDFKISEVLVLE